MITKNGTRYVRKLGQSRKSQSIYDHLGHPYDIEGKEVIFKGKEERAYSLTRGNIYKIIRVKSGEFCYDHDLANRNKKESNIETVQSEDYLIMIINDKGHKRRYSHLMFELKNKEDERN